MFKRRTNDEINIKERNKNLQMRSKQLNLELASSIAFVTLAESGSIDEVTATELTEVFASWASGVQYSIGMLRQYEGKLYKCVQPHKSQDDWTPNVSTSLWNIVGDPTEEYPTWSQPIGAHDAYMTGDKVTHRNKQWISMVDNNVWEPGTYGWEDNT